MPAIIDDRGRQYVVNDGDTLLIDYIADAEPGSELTFDRVLAVDGEFGAPVVEGAAVKARVEGHEKAKKILVQKFHRRKDYRRLQGHRALNTRLTITSISK
ncbi:MAG: 50S ribosomal protein L21 [Planctomycetota bacterium]|nr:MAG: 50S ribosomal protein L21 [Planctomycetota bacterium]